MSVNKVILIGRLGQSPELRYTDSGTPVASMSLATNRRWRDKEGELHEEVEWTKITVWGKQAESCDRYLSKGRQVYIEGRLKTNEWQDRDGNTRYTKEVVARDVTFLSGGSGGGGQSSGSRGGSSGGDDGWDDADDFDQSFDDESIPF